MTVIGNDEEAMGGTKERGAAGRKAAKEYPSDGKPQHELPFTPLREKTWGSHKPGFGTTEVPITLNNDPFDICDPIGFPRIELFNLRAIQILQTEKQVLIFYQNDRTFRSIWTDGRGFPPEDISEPRWYGYSIGKWEDDTTFVVETTGVDERTWIDNVGRPHSSDLRVEERFHRVNHDILELTLTIIDPKMYTKPWNAPWKIRHSMPAEKHPCAARSSVIFRYVPKGLVEIGVERAPAQKRMDLAEYEAAQPFLRTAVPPLYRDALK